MGIILSNIYNTVRHLPSSSPAVKAMAGASAIVMAMTANTGAQAAGAQGAVIMGGIFAIGCLTVTSIVDAHQRAHRAAPAAPATIGNGPV